MPMYEIEQYEIHATKYRTKAANEAEAIVKLLDGEADPVDGSQEFIEIAEDVGLPIDEHHELAEQPRKLGVPVGPHVIPSIRGISLAPPASPGI